MKWEGREKGDAFSEKSNDLKCVGVNAELETKGNESVCVGGKVELVPDMKWCPIVKWG